MLWNFFLFCVFCKLLTIYLLMCFQICRILCDVCREYHTPLHLSVSCVGRKRFCCPLTLLAVYQNSVLNNMETDVSSWTQALHRQAVKTVCLWTSGRRLTSTCRLLVWMWWCMFMTEVWWLAVDMNLVSYSAVLCTVSACCWSSTLFFGCGAIVWRHFYYYYFYIQASKPNDYSLSLAVNS